MTADSSDEGPRTYFYLSFARVQPMNLDGGGPAPEVDPAVKRFYDDLCAEVQRWARPDSRLGIGSIDQPLTHHSKSSTSMAHGLRTAEVFVPLYSPRYLDLSSPRSEQTAFAQRLTTFAAEVADEHVQPVLWIPILGPDQPDDDHQVMIQRALSLGDGVPHYQANGLWAMLRMPAMRTGYPVLLERLARRIVTAAERRPLGASTAQPTPAEPRASAHVPFVVAVLAPTRSHRPRGRAADTYGQRPCDWRTFAPQADLAVASYAANVAETLGMASVVVDYDHNAQPFGAGPGVLLVDPWYAAQDEGRAIITAAVQNLPPWAVAVVALDPADPQYSPVGARHADELLAALHPMRRTVYPAEGARELTALLPGLVTKTRKRYLNARAQRPSTQPSRTRRAEPPPSQEDDR